MSKLTRQIRAYILKAKMDRSIKKLQGIVHNYKCDVIAENRRYAEVEK